LEFYKDRKKRLMKNKINILVTAVGGGGHGEQILKALLQAKNSQYRIFGADMNPYCPQFQLVSDYAVLPRADDPDFIERVLEICARFEIEALFHGCEPELKRYSDERHRFAERGIFLPLNPKATIDTCLNKEKTFSVLRELGFEVPRFARVTNRQELNSIAFFPSVVKPSVGGGGSSDVYIVQSMHELLALSAFIDIENSQTQFVIQEYVGSPDEEYTVGVLHDMDGEYINSIALRRHLSGQLNIRSRVPNRSNKQDLGSHLVVSSGISHGHLGRFSNVTEPCVEIARAINSTSALNIQCRLVGGKVKVFEINPRFSGTTSLRAMVGYNEPDLLIRKHILGEEIIPNFSYEEGIILRSLVESRLQ
jgi:carbamoyl-phosphate synthase large subunit